ncbi:MAG: phosphoglycerate dehydrogenase, partial [Acidobacteria bacterium]|nr:phosphoglycerate dehydrogenase [Acidobacteriota bacterium]
MRILVADAIAQAGVDLLLGEGWEVVVQTSISARELRETAGRYDAIIVRSRSQIDARVLEAATVLRAVGRAGAGVDNIDVETATRRGVLVMNTPGGNSVSVAEFAIGLMLCAERHITLADRQMKEGRWEKKSLVGHELRGKTLGVVGLGKVGQEVAKRAKYCGMTVLAHDPFISERVAQDLNIALTSFDDLLRQSDIISLHAALNNKTNQLINRQSLELLKPTAVLVNCARGELIDEAALIDALDTGRLRGAALDVFQEEPSTHQALLSHPRVVATPHIAASTVEAQEQVGVEIAIQIRDYLKSGEIRNAVNFPSIPPEEFHRMSINLDLGERLGRFVAQIADLRSQEIGLRYYGESCALNA